VFVRFAGCNLWSGLERDRGRGPGGCSAWCDTDFVGTEGTNGGKFASAEELVRAAQGLWPTQDHATRSARPFAVCTGGEPLLQLDQALLTQFRATGWEVAIETNGTQMPPPGDFWLTVSPKAASTLRVRKGNELKLVFPQVGAEPERFADLEFDHFYLQPMDGPERAKNLELALAYCLSHPQWKLSLQTHKILSIL
jgi:7-carboxy-7-deazaguanine synthase